MRNRNLLVLGFVIILIVAVAVLALIVPQQRIISEEAPTLTSQIPEETPSVSSMPESTESAPSPTPAAAEESTSAQPARAYLLVSVKGVLYEPIPLYSEGSYTVRQTDIDAENVIHVTEDSVYMESSTCENQDCVLQGTVSLENMAERVLGNMIICLPNQVTLELYTPEGLADILTQME